MPAARRDTQPPPAAKVLRTSTQAVANSTATKVQFATVDYDPYAMWDSTNFQLVIPQGWGGIWLVGASFRYSSVPTNPARVSIQNGAGSLNYITEDVPVGGTRSGANVMRAFNVGDTLIAVAFHSNGAGITVGAAATEDTCMWAVFLRPV